MEVEEKMRQHIQCDGRIMNQIVHVVDLMRWK